MDPTPLAGPGPYGRPSRLRLRDVPTPFWVGGALAALGFVVHVYVSHVSSGADGYSCSYTDLGALAVAVAVAACVVGGWVSRGDRHVRRRLATPVMVAISVVLLALAVVHVARGLGVVDSPCDAHPMP